MKLEESDTAVIVQPDRKADAVVIWLHGLGADGHDFVPIVRELELPKTAAVRFVFPHAPVRPVTLNGGLPMRAWYDILSLARSGKQDVVGLRESESRIRGLIAQERENGIARGRIVLAGFSQGGAVALQTALRHPERLAGLMALSTYLPLADTLGEEASPANRDLPILMCHGAYDSVLPLELGEWSRDRLLGLDYKVEWHRYPMAHEVCLEEIERIGTWLTEVLAV
jgi:phospholipase/carboxylesterase